MYLALVLVLAVVLYAWTARPGPAAPGAGLTQEEILADLANLEDNSLPVQPVLGGRLYATGVMFPLDFAGRVGDQFWVVIEDGHVLFTLRCQVVEPAGTRPGFAVRGVQERLVHPPGSYQPWVWDGQQFVPRPVEGAS